MTCKECKYYKETYPNKGYCRMWDEYMKELRRLGGRR